MVSIVLGYTKAIKQEETQRQLTRLHDGRGSLAHDDRVDVLSAAVAYWEDHMGVNIDNVIAKNTNRLSSSKRGQTLRVNYRLIKLIDRKLKRMLLSGTGMN